MRTWEFDNYRRLAQNLSSLLGRSAEVVVHDLADLEHSVVFIAGDVTHRTVGSPMTNVGLEALKLGTETSEQFGSYRSVLPDGRVLKSSSTFFRNAEGKSTVALCINLDVTQWRQAAELLSEFSTPEEHQEVREDYRQTVPEMIGTVVSEAVDSLGKQPALMDGSDKVEVMRALEKRGVFLIKGALGYVATTLGVSRATAYNYLQRVRTEQAFPGPQGEV